VVLVQAGRARAAARRARARAASLCIVVSLE
jgi:hypothetical protein